MYHRFPPTQKLDSLIGNEETRTKTSSFLRRWTWLRWIGTKTLFDKLCAPIFSSDTFTGDLAKTRRDISMCAYSVSCRKKVSTYKHAVLMINSSCS